MTLSRIILTLLFFGFASPATANENIPLLYTRETLTIQRAAQPQPWQEGQPPKEHIQEQAASGVTFDVEVRDAKSFYSQKDWFNLSGPTDDSGVLLVFAQPGKSPIIASKQYAPLDILFIDAQGRVTQIVPNILLSNLGQQIVPQNPVLAFLFLKGQTCQRLGINPGDIVNYKIFSQPPLVLGDPVAIVDAPARQLPRQQVPHAPAAAKPPALSSPGKPTTNKMIPQLPPLPPVPNPARATQAKPQIEEKDLPQSTKDPLPKNLVIRPSE